MDLGEEQRRLMERIQNEQFERNLQKENQFFQKRLVAQFIEEYTKTNQQLKTINENLQKQIQEAAASAKKSKAQAKVSLIVSIISIIVSATISIIALCV